ncbi:hypothetical protein SAMD00019534_036990 [Acytostelium subglobosum LB1]|uniref:hypothetical protein n=1 Tax=Acytostelium subglobosum LB1 TaxID=1410327 RepID=UPI00064507A8|nr:hypothetical protein SAMD00019534_036990 [Acytostelium subglobosum LB1]GAM20524.1 hypothetical protein SAMD00019534_036990 [Acytostelium subglobosum LB1]|eukprot:XP_012760045.1 hypothetical protein SAMD00019534_036990 [Acytostelium subglobosum LB1]
MASVVVIRAATEVASTKAVRTTLVGSMMACGNHCSRIIPFWCVVTVLAITAVQKTSNDDGTIDTCVLGDGLAWHDESVAHDLHSDVLIKVFHLDLLECQCGVEQGRTTAWHDTLLNGGTCGVQSVLNTVLLLANLDLGGTADADHTNAAGPTWPNAPGAYRAGTPQWWL